MRRPLPRPARPLAVFLLMAAAACTDRNPAAAPDASSPALPPSARAMLTCTVSVHEATLACAPAEAMSPAGVSAAVIGGQGQNVRLASTGVRYDSTGTFRAEVTVENLTAQALGTANGVSASADGVRVFFSSPPVATEGTGPVEVANADGEGFFTAAAQKFFRYDGILAPGDTSEAREWRFTAPATVQRFTFGVYVAAAVRAEGGWLAMAPLAPALLAGDTVRVTAAARNLAGGAADAQPAAWTTSNAAVATVDSLGLVRGVAAGTATVTATAGGRTGSVQVRVYGAGDAPIATVSRLEIVGGSVEAGGGDTVWIHSSYSGPGSLVLNMEVALRHPAGGERICRAFSPIQSRPGSSDWRCGIVFPEGWRGGGWQVAQLTMSNRTVSYAALVAAGAPAQVYVHSRAEDRTAPRVKDVMIWPPTVVAGQDPVFIDVETRDDGVGTGPRAEGFVSSAGNPGVTMRAVERSRTDSTATYGLVGIFPAYFNGGTFRLDSVRVSDLNGNRRTYATAEMAAAGWDTAFTVVGENPDTSAPVITAFSFTPDTVAGNGADSVTVTLSAEEPVDESGVWYLDMEFEKESDTAQRRRCRLNGTGFEVFQRTMTCRVAFGAGDAGAWRVRYIRAIDNMDHHRVLFTGDVDRAGYPVALTVTAP